MAYATVDELQFRLRIDNPTKLQLAGLQRVLDAAAGEIDWFLGTTVNPLVYDAEEVAIVTEVNLRRALEFWHEGLVAYGTQGLGSDVPLRAPRVPFERHAAALAPLRHSWPVA